MWIRKKKLIMDEMFSRSRLLFGDSGMEAMACWRVIIFGVGGVGSWCAESLVRTGFTNLTLVDSDCVAVSNLNRQLMATSSTIDRPKVEALRDRLLDINPHASITALQQMYNAETADSFHLETYDVVVDAIDSLQAKADLILHATRLVHANREKVFVSSMGAALRIDPTRVQVAEFWKVKGDALARALRNKFKRSGEYPACKFSCVYSEEPPLANQFQGELGDGDLAHGKVQANGSLCHITGIFGLTLAGLIVQKIPH